MKEIVSCILFRIVEGRRCCFCILLNFTSCSHLVYMRMLGFSAVYSTLCFLTWPHFCPIIADIPGCILCKWVRAHGDSLNSISDFVVVWHFFLGNLKVCCHVHKNMPLDPILCPLNPAYTWPPYFSKMCFDVVLTAMHRSFKWPFIRLSHKNFYAFFFPPYVPHALFHPPSPWFYHTSNIWQPVEILKVWSTF
jgi:hypothetical protein